jgi:predicted nucleic acid-binding protein
MKIVSDSTTLIALSRIKELDVLCALFGTIMVPIAVYNEIALEGGKRPGVKDIANAFWIIKRQVQDRLAVSVLQTDLDNGEAEAVVLAKEFGSRLSFG